MRDDFMLSSNNDYEGKRIADIEKAASAYLVQVEKVKHETYVKDALLTNYVQKINSHVSRYDLCNVIALAQKEIGARLKKDRPNFETLKRWLLEDFLNGDKTFKITKILQCGYGGYAWKIELTGYDTDAYLEIPAVNHIDVENVGYANYGQFAFGVYKSKDYMTTLKQSYDMKVIAEFIKEYFKEKTNEN
jgi:hypothetical protein